MARTPAEQMRHSADVQESRNAEYGSAYKRHGPSIAPLFPEGVNLVTADDHARFAILTLIYGKLVRYTGSFAKGGHEDSLTDIIAYTAMLKEVDEEAREAQPHEGLLDCDDPSQMAEVMWTEKGVDFQYTTSPEQAQAIADRIFSRNPSNTTTLSEEAKDKLSK